MIKFTLLLLPMLLLLSCSQPFSHDISGVIYEKTRDDLFQHDFSKIIIDINSPGGVAGPSIEIAELLMKKNVVLNVKDICNSACSQLILPIADKINFIDEPLIGFHSDMILDVEYFKRNGEDYKTCLGLNEAYERERIILEHNGLNQDFWKEIDKRLMMQNFNVTMDINGDCIDYIYDLKHIMWYPTSSQLKDLFGLKFKGSVCADDYTACSEKITEIAAKEGAKDNFSMVIGDKVYSHKIDK